MAGNNNQKPTRMIPGKEVLTPELLRREAYEMAKCQRQPGPGPQILLVLADLIDTAELDTPKPCPKCGKDCRPCSGAHPAYDVVTGRILRISIVDYLCVDCPDIWAHWGPLGVADKEETDGE